jgi:hypothetical protein
MVAPKAGRATIERAAAIIARKDFIEGIFAILILFSLYLYVLQILQGDEKIGKIKNLPL